MIKFFLQARIVNCENKELKKTLETILSGFKLEEEEIISILEKESLTDEKFRKKVEKNIKTDTNKKKLLKTLIRTINKENTEDKRKINARKRKIYLELIKTVPQEITNENRMVVILDNYPTHYAKMLKEATEHLNMEFVYLPSYSPKLNPIEQVWRTIRKELSTEFIKGEEFLKNNFERIFYEIVDRPSFTKNWKKKFITDVKNEIELAKTCLNATLMI